MTEIGPLPGPRRHRDDDDTAEVLREVLRRQAAAVRPSPDGLERVLAAAHAARRSGPPPGAAEGPAGVAPLVLVAATDRGNRAVRWLPVVAAAAVVVILSAGLGLVRLGMIDAPGIQAVVGAPPQAAPAPYPPAADPLPVYFVERQNDRWALVREFTPTTLRDPSARLEAAVRLAVSGHGTDPDHTSAWTAIGLTVAATPAITVATDADGPVVRLPAALLGAGLEPRPGQPPATLAVQQLVWTATATAQSTDPVRISGPTPGAKLFGSLPLDGRFARAASDPRAPVWVSSLVDGQLLAPGRAVIQGDAVTTEHGTVAWRLLGRGGLDEVASGVATLRREKDGVPRPGERAVWEVVVQIPDEGAYQFQVSQPWPGTRAGTDPAWMDTDWVDTKDLLVAGDRP